MSETESNGWYDLFEDVAAKVKYEARTRKEQHQQLERIVTAAHRTPTDAEVEALAVKHEAFGFGRVDAKGYTTHGFDPEGLRAFVNELLELANTKDQP